MKTSASLLGLLGLALAGTASAVPTTWSANGHTYDIIAAPYTSWDAARAGAQSLGAGWDLATITSLDEQMYIAGLLGPANGSLTEYYIGGQYVNGSWTWVSGEAFVFTYFGNGEPNGNASEPRLALDGRMNVPNWGWNDYVGDGAYFVAGYVVENGGTQAVPEPGTLALFGLGIAGLGLGLRRRKK